MTPFIEQCNHFTLKWWHLRNEVFIEIRLPIKSAMPEKRRNNRRKTLSIAMEADSATKRNHSSAFTSVDAIFGHATSNFFKSLNGAKINGDLESLFFPHFQASFSFIIHYFYDGFSCMLDFSHVPQHAPVKWFEKYQLANSGFNFKNGNYATGFQVLHASHVSNVVFAHHLTFFRRIANVTIDFSRYSLMSSCCIIRQLSELFNSLKCLRKWRLCSEFCGQATFPHKLSLHLRWILLTR